MAEKMLVTQALDGCVVGTFWLEGRITLRGKNYDSEGFNEYLE